MNEAKEVEFEIVDSATPQNQDEISTKLVRVAEEQHISPETAGALHQSFSPMFKKARSVLAKSRAIEVKSADQKLEIKLARECRLALKAIRVEGNKVRAALKEDSLRRGKAIDGFFNILCDITETEEKRLEEQEKFVERQEAARKAALRAVREEEMHKFGVDTSFYALGEMPEEDFRALLASTQIAYEAKIEAALKAEAEMAAKAKAEAEERERIRLENERLKKEVAEREAAAKTERERIEAQMREAAEKARKEREAFEAEAAKQKAEFERIRKEAEDKARKEREEVEAKARAEREAAEKKAAEERRKSEAKAKAEREAREKAEAELKAARDAEARRVADEQAAKAKAAAAPDREKLQRLAATVRSLRTSLLSDAGRPIAEQVNAQLEKFAAWIESKAASLP